ncbi:MAG: hypothetical protein BGO45_04705 [Microbacterium sp. 71-36]|uniref:hypothetical protein n=1 Tax=unclassified Microbacterium TaxID=2609290 RepID=UPI00086B0814|nr:MULTISPECIES: hypothetical protein [unclassified Microbacterium]MBN9210526.1 hypothetical protein [Microbacterium sp.]ODT43199.1 MAG: hypothetical protein ABS60_00160 [Microbacterium sp. SCN 71-17]OJV75800.1 MAG: hypothetical protein BGO45_04705 [Microbacterium sp. 71-36]
MSLVALPQPDPHAVDEPSGFEDLPAVMSPRVLAEVLDVTPRTLERWRVDKIGPAWMSLPGSSLIRYGRADVVAWLAAARVEVTR